MAETVKDIDGIHTVSKSLTPGFMLSSGGDNQRGENKRVLK